jgi:hypothetical protein
MKKIFNYNIQKLATAVKIRTRFLAALHRLKRERDLSLIKVAK